MAWLVSPNLPLSDSVEKETFTEAVEYARKLCNEYSEVVVASQGEKFPAIYVLRKLWD